MRSGRIKMENTANWKQDAQRYISIFVPAPIPNNLQQKFPSARPLYRSLFRKCWKASFRFRQWLTPVLHSTCATLATVALIIAQGLLVFLLLLLYITLQELLSPLDNLCNNNNGTTYAKSNATATASVRCPTSTLTNIEDNLSRPLQYTTTFIFVILVIEVVLRLFIRGKRLWRHYWDLFDFFLTITSFAINLTVLQGGFTLGRQVSQLIILLRLWRILDLITERSGSMTVSSADKSDSRNYLTNIAETGRVPSALAVQLSTSSTATLCGQPFTVESSYAAEQSVTTLMLRIEELEQEIIRLNNISNMSNNDSSCQSCRMYQASTGQVLTTERLLDMACMQLTRSASNGRKFDELRPSKSMDDLSQPESGYNSTQRRERTSYPINYRASDRIWQDSVRNSLPVGIKAAPVDIGGVMLRLHQKKTAEARKDQMTESQTELSEIQRVARIEFCPDDSRQGIPTTSL
ncbi:hypothetical protein RvY_17838 [Ramazzottius varieornatus]|uniref:Voltage-gated hydrogen channel 1 n=1 Tax=Ramazzottius varieornatus TaxID=947166 RepID=A0A1D1W475_RAMVA|nr:hypothetical protein RvY_17838 [Ramazzottius varieornatus]